MKTVSIQKINKAVAKLKKKLKIADMAWILQESVSNEKLDRTYAFSLHGISSRLTPLTFFATDEDSLVKKVLEGLAGVDFDQIDIDWHKAKAFEYAQLAEQFNKYAKDAENRRAVEGSSTERTLEVLEEGSYKLEDEENGDKD